MLFAGTLRLKGPAPRITYGQIKSRRKLKPVAPYLTLVSALGNPRLSALDPMPFEVSVRPTRELEHVFDEDVDDYYDYGGYYDYYDYRELEVGDAEDYIVPRLRAKLGARPDEGIARSWYSQKSTYGWNRYRSHKTRQREQSKITRPDKYRSA